jgi:hypothetical protein
MDAALMKGMAREADERHQTASEFAAALKAALG